MKEPFNVDLNLMKMKCRFMIGIYVKGQFPW